MNDSSKSFTYIWSSISIGLLLAAFVYVNSSLSNHIIGEAAVISEGKVLSARFVEPMRQSQNADLVDSLQGFRNSDALSRVQAPEIMSVISASPSVSEGISLIDKSLDRLKDLNPSAAKVHFESLVSRLEASHADHKRIIDYANMSLLLACVLIFGLLLWRIAKLNQAVQLAGEYLELNEQASYYSENDELETQIEDYSIDGQEGPSKENRSEKKQAIVTLLSLEQELQGVLNDEVERTGHLATLHGASLDEELLPSDHAVIARTIFESLVRNSVIHGGQSPRDRENSRKDKTLNVFIGIEESETEYTLTVADDGEGIEGKKVRDHALAQNLISPEVANGLTQESAARLVFLPGYSSTQPQGNHLSLEQVRALIKEQKGSIGMQNKVGDLCKFIIRLPKLAA